MRCASLVIIGLGAKLHTLDAIEECSLIGKTEYSTEYSVSTQTMVGMMRGLGNFTIADCTRHRETERTPIQQLKATFQFSPRRGHFARGINRERAAHILVNLIFAESPVVDAVDSNGAIAGAHLFGAAVREDGVQ